MNEFLFIAGLFLIVMLLSFIWVACKALFERWMHNDWCKHSWGEWADEEGTSHNVQRRYCAKCKLMERRVA